ncbi:MAG: hypothetical protein KAS07_05325, partial [Candidatus Pacebacteria bacterium]|nr:hypothetical protein [Candidatus Paceibacterota bacterium]
LWLSVFLWQEHHTLKKIPSGMNLSRWQAGMWRPSLITLSLTDGFRYFHLFHVVFFFLFSLLFLIIPPQEFWREELTWDMWLTHIAIAMSIPLFFSLFVIPKMISDYRLFAKGIPVRCKKVGSKTESLTTGYMRHGSIRTNTEHFDRDLYEATYKDNLYQFSAPAMVLSGDQTIALIDPKHPKHSILLNTFYE